MRRTVLLGMLAGLAAVPAARAQRSQEPPTVRCMVVRHLDRATLDVSEWAFRAVLEGGLITQVTRESRERPPVTVQLRSSSTATGTTYNPLRQSGATARGGDTFEYTEAIAAESGSASQFIHVLLACPG